MESRIIVAAVPLTLTFGKRRVHRVQPAEFIASVIKEREKEREREEKKSPEARRGTSFGFDAPRRNHVRTRPSLFQDEARRERHLSFLPPLTVRRCFVVSFCPVFY